MLQLSTNMPISTKSKMRLTGPNEKDITLTIPGFIAAEPELSLSEQVALATIHYNPRCSNLLLARKLGLSSRGTENLIARLKGRGLLVQIGSGASRRLRLTFHAEHHTLCADTDTPHLRTNCGERNDDDSLRLAHPSARLSEFEVVVGRRQLISNCLQMGEHEAALQHLVALREIAERELTGEPRDQVMRVLADDETVIHGLKVLSEMPVSRQERIALTSALGSATSAQLAVLRERFQNQAELAGAITALALPS